MTSLHVSGQRLEKMPPYLHLPMIMLPLLSVTSFSTPEHMHDDALKDQALNLWVYKYGLYWPRDDCLFGFRLLFCEEILTGTLDRW